MHWHIRSYSCERVCNPLHGESCPHPRHVIFVVSHHSSCIYIWMKAWGFICFFSLTSASTMSIMRGLVTTIALYKPPWKKTCKIFVLLPSITSDRHIKFVVWTSPPPAPTTFCPLHATSEATSPSQHNNAPPSPLGVLVSGLHLCMYTWFSYWPCPYIVALDGRSTTIGVSRLSNEWLATFL